MVSIRPIRANDHGEVIDIWHSGWHDAHADIVPKGVLRYRTIEYFGAWLRDAKDKFHVADDGRVLGFVSTQGPEIVKLYVHRDTQGTGIASKLLSYGENELNKKGVTDAVLFCTAANARAQRFYDREGWALSKTFPDKLWLPNGVSGEFIADTHLYQKRLN